jgi:hypothetical protein
MQIVCDGETVGSIDDVGFSEAIRAIGASSIARSLGIHRQTVYGWERLRTVPLERAIALWQFPEFQQLEIKIDHSAIAKIKTNLEAFDRLGKP